VRVSNISGKLLAVAVSILLSGCASIYTPVNEPISVVDEDTGYRRVNTDRSQKMGDTLILLAFSGGGTRAAALSYGVMQELRDTYVVSQDKEVSLLQEVDTISSVSGGSFTAAYYGVFRDKLFETYEKDFLRQDVQSTLIRKLISPGYWLGTAFSGFDRTEMAIDFYDRTIFKGATFNDMAANGPPFIDINATDLTTGMRFTFSQDLFDMICSDLGSMKVARAVTASSAVPVAFPTIVLENHADQCDVSGTREWDILQNTQPNSEAQAQLLENLRSYRDHEKRKYIHLVDGGISDNLGLRAMIDRLEGLGDNRFDRVRDAGIKNILIILVNAAVERDSFIEQSAKKPKPATTMSAFIDSQMKRYDQETIDRLHQNIDQYQARADEQQLPLQIFFSEVTFDHVQLADASSMLNNMPTSLELSDRDVDQLIASARILLRHEPSFKAFKERNQGRLAEGAMSESTICEYYAHPKCAEL
jgi:NTE family protein